MTKEEFLLLWAQPDTTQLDEWFAGPADQKEKDQVLAWIEEQASPPELGLAVEIPDTSEIEERIRAAPAPKQDERALANRQRAARGNMLRKLKKVFTVYERFTPQIASERSKVNVYDVASYLASEAKLPGAQIVYDEPSKTYYIRSMFGE